MCLLAGFLLSCWCRAAAGWTGILEVPSSGGPLPQPSPYIWYIQYTCKHTHTHVCTCLLHFWEHTHSLVTAAFGFLSYLIKLYLSELSLHSPQVFLAFRVSVMCHLVSSFRRLQMNRASKIAALVCSVNDLMMINDRNDRNGTLIGRLYPFQYPVSLLNILWTLPAFMYFTGKFFFSLMSLTATMLPLFYGR